MQIIKAETLMTYVQYVSKKRNSELRGYVSTLERSLQERVLTKLRDSNFLLNRQLVLIPVMPLAVQDNHEIAYVLYAFIFEKEEPKQSSREQLIYGKKILFDFRDNSCSFCNDWDREENNLLFQRLT